MSGGGRASPDLLQALGVLLEPPEQSHYAVADVLHLLVPATLAKWRTCHTKVFIEQCHPRASVYVSEAGAMGGEAADRVAGFRRAIGAGECAPPDALSQLMADYAALSTLADSDTRAQHARRALLWEHLLAWLPPYLSALARTAPDPYRQWAYLTERIFRAEALAEGPPETLPLHLRLAPDFAEDNGFTSVDGLIRAILTPIRCGCVFTQADLSRAAHATNLGASFGSRHFLLRTLLEQKPGAIMHWLTYEAHCQADAYCRLIPDLGDVALFWRERARDAAKTLKAMAGEAEDHFPMDQGLLQA